MSKLEAPMNILALDPGTERTAWARIHSDPSGPLLSGFGIDANEAMLSRLEMERQRFREEGYTMAVEMVACYGMAVGREVFETCVWVGRFVQAWQPREHVKVYRRDVKHHMCNSVKAKDSNVRQALLDMWGGKVAAVGNKAKPGPLHGVSKDVWAALAVAVTAEHQIRTGAK